MSGQEGDSSSNTTNVVNNASTTTTNPAVRYRELVSECNQLMGKVADLESDLVEHLLVEDTLKPLDGGRRAYRLVGDVLVERSVAEVLPSITKNKEHLDATIHAMKERLSLRQKEAADLKAKYNFQ
ncbi:prefoldin subunit domain containing protein [Nitzschia inconspicua]|uniref:Prefoldin subunit domain containing protein n=1 Tax=Nitzschia inconspicua TaxID=303405 RepID=A0A9K3PQB9_9STRA|nr:prefoldin subunit domain containing protein [Nitzschia inconspicua]